MSSKAHEVKVVLLGDAGVGKSSLMLRFVTKNFKPHSESTIGASYMSKVVVVDGRTFKYQIWDTAGQEKYHSLAPMYYRKAAAALVVHDITSMISFNRTREWVKELRNNGPKNITIVIVANKSDLETDREVPVDLAREYAESIDATFVETSAKTDHNVTKAFIDISSKIEVIDDGDDLLDSDDEDLSNNSKKTCC